MIVEIEHLLKRPVSTPEEDNVMTAFEALRDRVNLKLFPDLKLQNLPDFPDVTLLFVDPISRMTSADPKRNTLPLYKLYYECTAVGDGEARPCVFMGTGSTFLTALGSLMDGINFELHDTEVWKGNFTRKTAAENWSYLCAHPLFGGHFPEILRISRKLDLFVSPSVFSRAEPQYVLDTGPWYGCEDLISYDEIFHVASSSFDGALGRLANLVRRCCPNGQAVCDPTQLRQAHETLQRYDIDRLIQYGIENQKITLCPKMVRFNAAESMTDKIIRLLPEKVVADTYEEAVLALGQAVQLVENGGIV